MIVDLKNNKVLFSSHPDRVRPIASITKVITALVVLDAFGKCTHFADANRLRDWLETGKSAPVPAAALTCKKQKASQTVSNE